MSIVYSMTAMDNARFNERPLGFLIFAFLLRCCLTVATNPAVRGVAITSSAHEEIILIWWEFFPSIIIHSYISRYSGQDKSTRSTISGFILPSSVGPLLLNAPISVEDESDIGSRLKGATGKSGGHHLP